MKKDCGHAVRPRCFGGVELLECHSDFLSCESLGELCVHLFCDTPRYCTSDFIDLGGVGGGVYFLRIRCCSGYDTFLAFIPYTIIIPKLQNGILFPPFRSSGVEKFSVSVTLPVPMEEFSFTYSQHIRDMNSFAECI